MKRVKQAFVVVDLGNGDGGKGTVTDSLTRRYNAHTVIRFNGGSQAGHNVVTPEGQHHTFSQFGSGSFVVGVETFLSRHVLVDPGAFLKEAECLATKGVTDIFDRTLVSERAQLVTPFHAAVTQLRELDRGQDRHGSVGVGIGEAARIGNDFPELALRAKDVLGDPERLRTRLRQCQEALRAELRDLIRRVPKDETALKAIRLLESAGAVNATLNLFLIFGKRARIVNDHLLTKRLQMDGTVIFEAAQGVLIDERIGFFPYVTRSDCTSRNADTLLGEARYGGAIERLGVLRAYAVRHGPGPLVSEDPTLGARLHENHNQTHLWQGAFRHGHLDLVATRYALERCPVDALAITCLDQLEGLEAKACVAYDLSDGQRIEKIRHALNPHHFPGRERLTARLLKATPVLTDMPDPLSLITETFPLPLHLTSHGPTATDKRWYPDWGS